MILIRSLVYSLLLFTFNSSTVNAQACSGSLGDPIVNITFGKGSNFGAPLPAGSTSVIQYVSSQCPNDGYYSIVNSTSGCFGNSWQTVKDHTGDGNGYFMLVNASYDPSVFFVRKIDGLCPGTYYEFAAWLINVLNRDAISPNITFTIEKEDGEILMSYNTGDLLVDRSNPWKQYGFNFTTPADVSTIVLRLRNNAPGGIGNDVGLDDITFRPAGPAISVDIAGYTADTLVICPDNREVFRFNTVIDPCYISAAYQWQLSTDNGITWQNIPGETTPSFIRQPTLKAGVYLYRIAVAQTGNIGISNCRVVSRPLGITILSTPAPDLGVSTFLCKGDSLLLSPGSFDSYRWQDGSTDSTFKVLTGGNYSVTVSNACESVSAAVQVQDRVCGFFFPSAFSPNGDGKNETFTLLSSYALKYYQLRVFNRWGQQVFFTNDYQKGWDGTLNGIEAQPGTYIWKADMQVQGKNELVQRKGTVQLIR
ncbi:gliding motility-associated C-terminal domain-containing protein [Flavihumibacter fluvii]|uniref:gliding motility-associated C-terminal domain-containing protein n=1 Tax=Flavihumibacter fluvii TaxID=2838157 RepID=UPI001BDE7D3F|nr:gliding motility-associated C-terminal domain-containing protein [Flavihumibacter fluvii]ULQ54645.1 gliding motility-associated C-terminal domain-containing protein [Flavihumibacter fluvii]